MHRLPRRHPARLALGALTALVAVVVLTAGPPAYAVPPDVRVGEPVVTGYVLSGTSQAVIDASAAALGTLGVDGVVIAEDGRGVEQPDAGTRALVGAAHERGLRAELLVSNYSDDLGGFDTAAAGRLLRHEGRVRRVAATLAATAVSQGWDGITVDLESLRPADGPGLVRLVRELQARMPAELTVSVDLMAATSPRGYRRAGYRLGELAASADVLVAMTYDLHGPTWSGPGPIGPSSWQRRAIAALLTRVPAERVDLGVAGYGYTWPRAASGRTGSAVSWPGPAGLRTDPEAPGPAGGPGPVSGPRRSPTAPPCGGPTRGPMPGASSWPGSWACTASRCGDWARPTPPPPPGSRDPGTWDGIRAARRALPLGVISAARGLAARVVG